MQRLRPVHQGARAAWRRVVHRRARAHRGARPGGRAAGTAHLSGGSAGRERCVGALLAGGAARRFGGLPKGLARIGGARIADLGLAALASVTGRQVVVANDPRASRWFPNNAIVRDAVPGMGPLAGLATAIRAGGGAPVLVVAWDMPFVSGSLLGALMRRGEAAHASDVPVHGPDMTVEPLCAYYRPEAAEVAESLLARGERRARALYEALTASGGLVTMGDRAFGRFGDPAHLFTSVDTPERLASLGGTPPGSDGDAARR